PAVAAPMPSSTEGWRQKPPRRCPRNMYWLTAATVAVMPGVATIMPCWANELSVPTLRAVRKVRSFLFIVVFRNRRCPKGIGKNLASGGVGTARFLHQIFARVNDNLPSPKTKTAATRGDRRGEKTFRPGPDRP